MVDLSQPSWEAEVFLLLAGSDTQNNSGTPNLIPGGCVGVCVSFVCGVCV